MKTSTLIKFTFPVVRLYGILAIVGLLLFSSAAWAKSGLISVDALQLSAKNKGSCEQIVSTDSMRNQNWFAQAELWELEVLSDLPDSESGVFFLESPFYFEAATLLPRALSWQWHLPVANEINQYWPAYLSVSSPKDTLVTGDIILVCASAKLLFYIDAGISSEQALRQSVIAHVRLSSLTEGVLFAITLSAIGLALMMQRVRFLTFGAGMAMALLFVLVNNGTLLELPGGSWLMREWHMQRISGISSTIIIGYGLSRFLAFDQRHPRFWPALVTLLCFMGVLLTLSILPTPLRYADLSTYSNAAMIAIVMMLMLSAIIGLKQKHRFSIVLLVSWGPALLITLWLGAASYIDADATVAAVWLYPVALVYASSFLFTELARSISKTQAQRDLARLRAKTDHLTGAMTRGELDRRLKIVHADAAKGNADFALLFIDFDHFKRLNDNFGHAAGDTALVIAMQRIKAIVRNDDSVGRFGGEEFLVIVEGIKVKSAHEIAQRICLDIANNGEPIEQGLPPITVSIGIATYQHSDRLDSASILKRADEALYAAKQQGRNRVVIG